MSEGLEEEFVCCVRWKGCGGQGLFLHYHQVSEGDKSETNIKMCKLLFWKSFSVHFFFLSHCYVRQDLYISSLV